MDELIIVNVFSVDKNISGIECDSVRLPVSDAADGKFSGSYGIRKGHAKAAFALKAGQVCLTLKGENIRSFNISNGFATVENNQVCITVSSFNEE